jgi:uncharacterized repeat protein (TIGR03803 family)
MRPKRIGCSIKLPLNAAVAFLILTSASLFGAQTLQTLCSFNSTNGAYPYAALTLGNDGNFYGTTEQGGSSGYGTVFRMTSGGTLTTLISFSGTNGANPYAALTLDNDGNFYGTTFGTTLVQGGSSGYGTRFNVTTNLGTVFRVTTNGTLTTLYSFLGGNDGANPYAGLTLGNDGNFYGTTYGGGITNSTYLRGMGTVFKVTTNGALTTLVAFNSTNGTYPEAALTLGNDGNFYGTTSTYGGCNGVYGTVFQITTNGALTTLVAFNYTDGAYPAAALTLGNDGNFYGTTWCGGSSYYAWGTVFKVTTNGALTTLVECASDTEQYPVAPLVLGNDGNFYGTAKQGGSGGVGTVFRMTTNGTLTTLAAFNSTNGAYPYAGLTLGNDGNFYGTTESGGSGGYGTVFRLLLPPGITLQPQSQTNTAGATATFLVSAASPNPLSYQWQKNGTNLVDGGNISGATTNPLRITALSDSDAGTYSVVVTNSNGSVTSSSATLMVIDPPVITAQPTNLLVLLGTNAAFGVSLSGTAPFRYQWQFNGSNLLNAASAIYTIPSIGTNNVGNYAVVVTNAAGATISSNAALTVVLSPKSRTNYASSTATFTATEFGPELLNYQWQKNGTNLVEGAGLSGTTNSTLTIASVSDADAAIYSAVVSGAYGSVTTSNAVLTVNDLPFIASQPQSQAVLAGSNVTFNVTVYGAPPFVFQWYFNGTALGSPATGTNFSSCTLTNVGTNQAGIYSVEVVNGYGSVTSSNATLTVVALPAIATQPADRTNNAGTTATFSVVASNLSPLSYQWRKDGTNLVNAGRISGATNSTLTITSVSDSDAAVYSVTVTNLAGSATSSNATLTVIDPPVITTQPLGQRIMVGSSVSFNVSVSGTDPLRYRWRFNGASIPNATNATYAIQAASATNTGSYTVVVTNLAGSVTSSNAFLTVIVPPTLALQLWAGYPQLNLNGMLSSNFVVQYSTNLASSNWMNLLSLTNLPASPYLFLDPAGDGEPARFYRAFMQ